MTTTFSWEPLRCARSDSLLHCVTIAHDMLLTSVQIHSPVGTSIKEHHPSKHHVLSIPSELPMAYLWQPGEEKGTISIDKTVRL